MNQIQELLQPVHRCFCTLNYGRSPAYWQRNLLNQTTPLSFGQRACHWVKDLENVQVKLRKEPLLGSSLPALTGGCSSPPEDSSTATQPRLLRPDTKLYPGVLKTDAQMGRRGDGEMGRWWKQPSPSQPQSTTYDRTPDTLCPADKGVLAEKATSDQLSDDDNSPSSACVPLRLEPKAPSALLCHLAKQSSSERSFKEPACEQKPKVSPPKAVSPPPSCLDATSQQHWRQNLTRRTDNSLHREKAARYFPQRKLREPFNRVEQIDLTEQNRWQSALPMDAMRSQTNPWLRPLDGLTAPSDVLTHLANPLPTSSQTQASTLDRSSQYSSTKPTDSPTLLPTKTNVWQTSGLIEGTNAQSGPTQPFVPNRQNSGQVEPWIDSSSDSVTLPPTLVEPTAKVFSAFAETQRIAPPSVVAELPPLLAPQAGDASPSVTTAQIQPSARQEAIPEEDLGGLASKIKRILDEEARRYGINV